MVSGQTGSLTSRQQAWPTLGRAGCDWHRTRDFPSWPGLHGAHRIRPEIRLQSTSRYRNSLALRRGGVQKRMLGCYHLRTLPQPKGRTNLAEAIFNASVAKGGGQWEVEVHLTGFLKCESSYSTRNDSEDTQ